MGGGGGEGVMGGGGCKKIGTFFLLLPGTGDEKTHWKVSGTGKKKSSTGSRRGETRTDFCWSVEYVLVATEEEEEEEG